MKSKSLSRDVVGVPAGFTLLELLFVLVLLGLLACLLLPSLSRAKERARRISCLNNIRQITAVCLLYADENERGSFTTDSRGFPGQRLDKDDDLSLFYPGWIPSLPNFICPSTRNRVRPELIRIDPNTRQPYLVDLASYDHGPRDAGMSYECFGVMGWTQRKTINAVNIYRHQKKKFGLQGQQPGPSQIWLILDGERGVNDLTAGNHGRAGANVSFCDGRASWIAANHWAVAYELSQDEGDDAVPDELRISAD